MDINERMRQERERRGLSLQALEDRTCVRQPVLALIERGAWHELPSGLYGRFAVRAYAKAVGLDPDSVLREVAGLLRVPEDPLDGLIRVHGLGRRRRRSEPPQAGAPATDVPNREEGPPLQAEPPMGWREAGASAIDGLLLVFLVSTLLQLTAAVAGVPVETIVESAAPAIALVAGVVAIAYFLVLGGLRNATFGSALAQSRPFPSPGQPLDAGAVAGRALQWALRESSILVEWLLASAGGQHGLKALRVRRA